MAIDDSSGIEFSRWNRPAVALAGIVVFYCACNAIASWLPENGDDWYDFVFTGILVFEPMSFGVWCALGTGRMLTRLPFMLPCLLLLMVAPGINRAIMADLRPPEFVATVIAEFAIFAVTALLFLLLRRFARFRIVLQQSGDVRESNSVRFSMKYLFGLITLTALAAGMWANITFQTKPPSWSILGPDFYYWVLVYGGTIFFFTILPTTAAPLIVLSSGVSKRALVAVITFWVAITLLIFGVYSAMENEVDLNALGAILLGQLGAALAGSLAAILLRLAGLRLIRPENRRVVAPTIT